MEPLLFAIFSFQNLMKLEKGLYNMYSCTSALSGYHLQRKSSHLATGCTVQNGKKKNARLKIHLNYHLDGT